MLWAHASHGKGGELDLPPRSADLDAVEGIVDLSEGVDLEEETAPSIEVLKIHGGEYREPLLTYAR